MPRTFTPEELAKRMGGAAADALIGDTLERSSLTVEAGVKEEAPVKRGTLRRSITHRVELRALRAIVGTNLDYAPAVNNGSKAHIIRPKTKRALFWKGARHPVRSVRHPGTKGGRFMERGLEKKRGDVEAVMAAAGLAFFEDLTK